MTWAPDYLTLVELKAYLGLDDTNDDAELAIAITAASRAIDRWCNRQFGKTAGAETRYYPAWFDNETGRWTVDVDDLAVTPTVTLVDTTGNGVADQDITAFDMGPTNALANGKVHTRITIKPASAVKPAGTGRPEVKVTATPFGWPAFPVSVTYAMRVQANRFHNRRNSPYGVAGSPSDGSEMRLLARLDPDVAVSLSDYVRPRRPY